ncbi:MAG: CDP-diacylglycerol--serine O-phosphatidyltransferase [Thermoplasmata archaeon]|nr:CDP-diacylglycerol--serine O-phosphatidyltransferase [Thermoplasmata archaeon]
MRWMSRISGADIITLLNGLSGFLAITYILDGEFMIASCLIVLAIVFDGVDGAVARRFGSSHEFGKFLDSMSDSVSFCFAPALLVYGNLYNKDLGSAWVNMPNALAVIASMFLGSFGLLRLARFSSKDFKMPYFLGFPTPATALGIVMFCSLLGRPEFNPFNMGFEPNVIFIITMVLAFLMVSDVPYPKMTRTFLALAGLTGLLISLPMLAVILGMDFLSIETLMKIEMLAMLPFMAYLVGGPFYLYYQKRKKKREQ